MDYRELRQKFIDFFVAHGHQLVPSSSLVPQHDASVLLTTAGMQQFKPYFTGTPSPYGDRVVSIQKCFRLSDIDEVGDDTHLTFFEMPGHFSFGDYFKKEALHYAWEFIADPKYLGISPDRIYATYYNGDRPGTTEDTESKKVLESLPGLRKTIARGAADNFWGPTGNEGPCGPNVEFYVDDVEIWNEVFNEFYCAADGVLTPLSRPGVDMGGGLERILTAVTSEAKSFYDTDAFANIFNDWPTNMDQKTRRIMLDHGRAVTFLISDGVRPSNKEQGYVLRKLMRRMMAHFHKASGSSFSGSDVLGMDFLDIENLLTGVVRKYKDFYNNLDEAVTLKIFRDENKKFRQAINNGIRELKKVEIIDAKQAFKLFESYGLTYEIIKDFAGAKADNLNREDFDKEFPRHQEVSRAGVESKFGGHGLASGAQVSDEDKKIITRMHTVTHLLHAALIKFLGPEVKQAGSDLTTERIRFDFTFPRGMTAEERQQVEDWVNARIKEDLPVLREEKPVNEALAEGALAFFKEKYPDIVSVYTIYNESTGEVISKELCGGPHVTHTGEIGAFHIVKEQSSSAGVRRIRATIGKL
jgi:alanyl-tRNA synthetase